MTAVVSWIRKLKYTEELIIASDSRLCGGYRWDNCPKIMTLPRNDCAIAFAGETGYAYPLMMQAYFASSETNNGLDRAIDVKVFNGFLFSQINSMQGSAYMKADKEDIYDNQFIVGGYSWLDNKFRIWRYTYNKCDNKFIKGEYETSYEGKFGKIVFAGDAQRLLDNELRSLLREMYGRDYSGYSGTGFDMEPFEALVRLLRKAEPSDTIGGAPQMVKIYPHMNAKPIGVYWPHKDETNPYKNRTLLGRQLFDNEKCDYSFIDPDTFISGKMGLH